ncbi:MAG: PQQ-dependent sugar dehydrogenase [Candidatus Hydrogenedentes bacterium]|nr:PQQ-dependent sugar dehydrogenase [Candidatus Hydrogenedentota bacterium]
MICCATGLPATSSAQSLALQQVAAGLDRPVFLAQLPGDHRLFVVEQSGQIRILANGVLAQQPYLDISSQVTIGTSAGDERGLLGFAFHPDYLANGLFFVNYTTTIDGQLTTRVSRFSANGDPATAATADAASETELLSYVQPFNNHNGGMLAFGPNDGYLYIASGDGGSGNDPQNNAQTLSTLLGKLLRIDVNEGGPNAGTGGPAYDIPADNPFANGNGGLPEIWAYGLRNPWRFSFDSGTGDLYIGDVGQTAREEVDYREAGSEAGANFGWRVLEGTRCNTTVPGVTEETCNDMAAVAVAPVHEYPRTDGRAITGGYVYRGAAIPELQGVYIFGDYVLANIWSFLLDEGAVTRFQNRTDDLDPEQTLAALVSFSIDANGEIYVLSQDGGKVYRITREQGTAPAPQELLASFASADGDNSGGLTLAEAQVVWAELEPRVFGAMDLDGNDEVTERELLVSTGSGSIYATDTNGDERISLSELLRTIQFFNSNGLQCEAGSEDGYAPGVGSENCLRYSVDTNLDWHISLSEILRVIQFFNVGGYRYCPFTESEDGYCLVL